MRYTNKQLESMTDMELAADIIREKLAKLSNPYSPFASKLRRVYNTICQQAMTEKAEVEQAEKEFTQQQALIGKIVTAATDEIWGSLEQGPTGNYWIDRTHNIYCEKEEEFNILYLEEYFSNGELLDDDIDDTTTEARESDPHSQEALRAAVNDIIVRNANILDFTQNSVSGSGGGK